MKRTVVSSLFVTMFVSVALAWGSKGHDTVAAIAQKHLTSTTRAAIDSILQGRSIVYWANWLDNASHTPAYAYSKTWHYKNVDEGDSYESAPANPAGDAVTAIKAQIETLSSPSTSREDAELALKILVHIVGDLHQPLHMGHASDLGANRVKVKFFGRDANLHSVWDSRILESGHSWGYTEWVDQIDILSPEQAKAVATGSVDDWARETLPLAASIYKAFPEGKTISYNEVFEWTPVIEQQLLKGGLRLARVLNAIYDPASGEVSPWIPAK
ncbi:MAG: S1/P1 nuclease [Firmicutes bacterium]|nr:S1/P1 nuclease [Bacillota bacterium]MCM1400528.1 S1/P1 nuclease [Bacteroides sp.]MCM1476432.1 S1/P1 nuclease [Bacteroides sp.]